MAKQNATIPSLKVPGTPVAPPAATPPVEPAPVAEAEGGKKKKKGKRTVYTEVFPSPEDAVAEANNRTKGPRRAFKTTLNGTVLFVVANNEGRAGGVAFKQAGGEVEELGRARRAKALTSIDAIMEAVKDLPQDQQAKVFESLKNLGQAG